MFNPAVRACALLALTVAVAACGAHSDSDDASASSAPLLDADASAPCMRDPVRDALCTASPSDGTTSRAFVCETSDAARPHNGDGCGDFNATADAHVTWVCCP